MAALAKLQLTITGETDKVTARHYTRLHQTPPGGDQGPLATAVLYSAPHSLLVAWVAIIGHRSAEGQNIAKSWQTNNISTHDTTYTINIHWRVCSPQPYLPSLPEMKTLPWASSLVKEKRMKFVTWTKTDKYKCSTCNLLPSTFWPLGNHWVKMLEDKPRDLQQGDQNIIFVGHA